MTIFFDHVPPHIFVAMFVAIICIAWDAIDVYRLPPATGSSFGFFSQFTTQEDPDEVSKKEKRESRKIKIRLLRMRVAVFSILFTILSMNVQVIANLAFDVTLGWIQNALITLGPVACTTYALEGLIKMDFKD